MAPTIRRVIAEGTEGHNRSCDHVALCPQLERVNGMRFTLHAGPASSAPVRQKVLPEPAERWVVEKAMARGTLHVGIFCDYGFTLTPVAGIGVFVHNLINGLAALRPRLRLTVLANPRDRDGLAD